MLDTPHMRIHTCRIQRSRDCALCERASTSCRIHHSIALHRTCGYTAYADKSHTQIHRTHTTAQSNTQTRGCTGVNKTLTLPYNVCIIDIIYIYIYIHIYANEGLHRRSQNTDATLPEDVGGWLG
jgi:hypothetical protein